MSLGLNNGGRVSNTALFVQRVTSIPKPTAGTTETVPKRFRLMLKSALCFRIPLLLKFVGLFQVLLFHEIWCVCVCVCVACVCVWGGGSSTLLYHFLLSVQGRPGKQGLAGLTGPDGPKVGHSPLTGCHP